MMPRLLALSLLFAACGSSPAFPDAGGLDAGPDAVAGDAGLAQVTVHVRTRASDGLPDLDALVFFVNPDGGVAAQAAPARPAPSRAPWPRAAASRSATAASPEALTTVLAIADGDELWFGYRDTAPDQRVTVTVPTLAGATGYAVRGPCLYGTATGPTINTSFSRPCGATHALLAVANPDGAAPSYLLAPAVTPTDGGQLDVTGTWAAGTTATVGVTGLPAGATDLSINRLVMVDGATVDYGLRSSVPITAGAASVTVPTVASYGDRTQLRIGYSAPRPYVVVDYRPSLTEAAPLDVAPTLPAITAVTRTSGGYQWTLTGGGEVDAIVLDLLDTGSKGETLAEWRIIAPPSATSVTLPTLPTVTATGAELDAFRIVDASAITDHATLRREAGAGTWIDREPAVLPSSARLVVRYY